MLKGFEIIGHVMSCAQVSAFKNGFLRYQKILQERKGEVNLTMKQISLWWYIFSYGNQNLQRREISGNILKLVLSTKFHQNPCPCATTKRTFDSLIYYVSLTSSNQPSPYASLVFFFFLGTDSFIRGKPGSWRSNMWETNHRLYCSKQVLDKFYLSL